MSDNAPVTFHEINVGDDVRLPHWSPNGFARVVRHECTTEGREVIAGQLTLADADGGAERTYGREQFDAAGFVRANASPRSARP
jgi:hypothetical protein